MELKKNDRVLYADMFKGTLIENPYRNVGEKESYAEVVFDGHDGILHLQVDKLKKIEDEKILTENKLHNLELYKTITKTDMIKKFVEEGFEVLQAIKNNDMENLSEELLDMMQVCLGVAYTFKINLDDDIEKHNTKLLSRNHVFID